MSQCGEGGDGKTPCVNRGDGRLGTGAREWKISANASQTALLRDLEVNAKIDQSKS